jgi:hypothetical protein
MKSAMSRAGQMGVLRAAKVGVAALCLVAQAATLGHLLLVRHGFCAEHGEATEGGHAEVHTGSHELGGVSADEHSHDDDIDSHEHCAADVWRAGEAREVALLVTDPPETIGVELHPIADAPRVTALLLFAAPKTSPPA